MGHLDKRKQGIRSTKSPAVNTIPNPMEEPPQFPLNDKTNMVFMTMVDIQDQTGHFPLTSNKGNNYVVMLYTVDANHIKSYPIKSRHRSELLCAYNDVYSYRHRSLLHKLDNESSRNVEAFITENNASFQYTPPEIHRTNITEHAIRTWKNHFVAIGSGVAKLYCLSNWCKDLEQTDITLNMMRPCTQNPNLSAHEALEGMFSLQAARHGAIMPSKPVHQSHYGHWSCPSNRYIHFYSPYPAHTNHQRNADCIAKAIKNLENAINGRPPTHQNELEAIDKICNLITSCQVTPGLWCHKWCPVTFSLVVDDFGIKTVGLKHTKNLKEALQKYYTISVECTCKLF
ncbi:hypothetical protein ACHAW6_012694 [Cyclotella cf. meneghiniana]